MKTLIQKARQLTGLTQAGFARELSVSEASVQNWESGRNRPSPNQLKRIVGLAPMLKSEIEREIRQFEWHPKSGQKTRRYREETIVEAHAALDTILDNAETTVVEKVIADLVKFAGRFGATPDSKEPPPPAAKSRLPARAPRRHVKAPSART